MDSRDKPRRVTMSMLAETLGVTKTTISLALRGHSSVSEQTRQRVIKLAEEMGYRPDPAISSIAAQRWSTGAMKRHRVLAFLCHHVPHAKMLQAVYLPDAMERAAELGYKLEPFFVDEYPTAESVVRVLYSRGIRGLLIPSLPNPVSRRVMRLDWDKFTAVCCGIGRVRPDLHTVTSDLLITTRMVWELVSKLGYKKIGAALYRQDPVTDDDWQRVAASHAAVKLLHLEDAARIPFLVSKTQDEEELYQWYRKYKPTLIIALNNAVGEALERRGVKIPEQVELISLSAGANAKWSGITHNVSKIARYAVDILSEEIRNNQRGLPTLPRLVLIRPEWNSGTSFSANEAARTHLMNPSSTLFVPDIPVLPEDADTPWTKTGLTG